MPQGLETGTDRWSGAGRSNVEARGEGVWAALQSLMEGIMGFFSIGGIDGSLVDTYDSRMRQTICGGGLSPTACTRETHTLKTRKCLSRMPAVGLQKVSQAPIYSREQVDRSARGGERDRQPAQSYIYQRHHVRWHATSKGAVRC